MAAEPQWQLKHYLFIGGMPEAVAVYAESRDVDAVRRIQRRLLDAYDTERLIALHRMIGILQ